MQSNETLAQASDIFTRAAAYIEEYGWQRSGMSVHGKPRCSMGALASAHQEASWDPAVAKIMYDTLARELNGIGLTQFNNEAKGKDDVVRLFRRTADTLRKMQTFSHSPYSAFANSGSFESLLSSGRI